MDPRLTFSQIMCVPKCLRRHYYYLYVVGLRKDGTSPALRIGSAMHLAFETYGKTLDVDAPTQSEFMAKVEQFVKRTWPTTLPLIAKNAGWRSAEPSEKQLALCKKLRIFVPESATKGEVSTALDTFFNRSR